MLGLLKILQFLAKSSLNAKGPIIGSYIDETSLIRFGSFQGYSYRTDRYVNPPLSKSHRLRDIDFFNIFPRSTDRPVTISSDPQAEAGISGPIFVGSEHPMKSGGFINDCSYRAP